VTNLLSLKTNFHVANLAPLKMRCMWKSNVSFVVNYPDEVVKGGIFHAMKLEVNWCSGGCLMKLGVSLRFSQ
jgi:hypothetical protein